MTQPAMKALHLAPAEVRVLNALVQHGKNKLVARALGITPRTVEVYLYRIRQRLRDTGTLENPRPRQVLMRWWMESARTEA